MNLKILIYLDPSSFINNVMKFSNDVTSSSQSLELSACPNSLTKDANKSITSLVKLSSLGKPSNKWLREDFKKKSCNFMTSGKKVGGPKTKTKFQKKN